MALYLVIGRLWGPSMVSRRSPVQARASASFLLSAQARFAGQCGSPVLGARRARGSSAGGVCVRLIETPAFIREAAVQTCPRRLPGTVAAPVPGQAESKEAEAVQFALSASLDAAVRT